MFCPRCGEESPDGVRYCASCGGALPRLDAADAAADAAGAGPGGTGLRGRWAGRVRRLAGRNRRERILSGATAVLLIVAGVAFLNLDTPDEAADSPERDALDAACILAKAQVVQAANDLVGDGGPEGYAIRVVLGMMDLRDAATVSGLEGAEDLRSAALAAASKAGRVGRLHREQASTEELDAALQDSSAALEGLSAPTEALGLEGCASTSIDQTG